MKYLAKGWSFHPSSWVINIAKWLIWKIPDRLLAEPERFALAIVFTVVGADAVFLGSPASVLGQIPEAALINLEVGLFMLAGGLCKLAGLWRRRVWLQRLGAAFIVLGCIGFIVGVILYGSKDDIPIILVYALFAITYMFRLLSTTAARIKLYGRPTKND